jgi:LacI family transcriptional regulator
MAITIKDVAVKAGVSLSTVSLVLNNKKNVSEETRLKIMRAMEELDYHPRRVARGLASKRTGNIGFILTEDHFSRAEPFYTKIFLGSNLESTKLHYYVLLTTVPKSFRKDRDIPRFLLERNVDGIILAGSIPAPLIAYVQDQNLPVVFIDYLPKSGPCSAVLIDNFDGAYQAVSHLVRKGHRDIAFMAGDLEHPSLNERFEGYKRALSDAHIPLNTSLVLTNEPYTAFDDGYNATGRLLSTGTSFTAVFAGNDAMAQGCLRRLRENKIQVPDDVAIMGFDDVETDLQIEPHISSVHVEKEELGTVAVRHLVEMIKNGTLNHSKTVLPVRLVLRRSTGDQL